MRLAVPGKKDLVTVVGNLLGVQPGENLRLRGSWTQDRKYGEQFKAEGYVTVQPATLVGIEKYLGPAARSMSSARLRRPQRHLRARRFRRTGLAYACSIHKSQGSEYTCVVMPVHTQHYVMLQRNLLYTGITRARKLAVLVGARRALAIAVKKRQDGGPVHPAREQAPRYGELTRAHHCGGGGLHHPSRVTGHAPPSRSWRDQEIG